VTAHEANAQAESPGGLGIRKCPHCGKPFEPVNRWHIYDRVRCRLAVNAARHKQRIIDSYHAQQRATADADGAQAHEQDSADRLPGV
jgi:hypothetical protein